MFTTFDIAVSYGQICVFQGLLENPYNDWTQAHWAQGFTWRPISVSFSVLEDTLACKCTVQMRPDHLLRPDTIRAIQVPFSVAQDSRVAVGSILSETEINIAEGEYRLVYEVGLEPHEPEAGEEVNEELNEWPQMWCVLTFVPCQNAEPKILRQDEELAPLSPLYMEGWPA